MFSNTTNPSSFSFSQSSEKPSQQQYLIYTMSDVYPAAAPNISYFTLLQDPPAGTAFDPQPNGKPIPKLFQPVTIRGLTLHNRIIVSGIP